MPGTTLICETSQEKLQVLRHDPEALDDFDHVALEVMTTLDFETMVAEAGVRWMAGTPVFYDEDSGLALAAIAPAGLAWVLDPARELDGDEAADIDRLRAFVRAHGAQHIYELATF